MARPVVCALLSIGLAAAVSAAARQAVSPNAVVAADGSGQYTTVQDAINAAPQDTSSSRRWVIAVRPGTYKELVYVQREKRFVMLVGEDPARTVITYNRKASDLGPDGLAIGTFRTPTMQVDADDFSIENLTIENGAGPVGQALALRVDGDRVVIRNSRLVGWQDTVLLNRGRQYIEDSFISGHVDFIFGGATAFFERCEIRALRDGYLTAASTPAEQTYGFVFAHGAITGASPDVKTYLGRPWRPFAATAWLQMEMSAVVRPEGWHNWDHPEREQTVRYAEYATSGPGASSAARVKWARVLPAPEASALTAARVLAGNDQWNPASVPAHPSPVKAKTPPMPAAQTAVVWDQALRQPDAWYATPDAVRIADNVLRYQRHTGGWPKNLDMAKALSAEELRVVSAAQAEDDSTIDNGATVTQIRFLARVAARASAPGRFRQAALRGIDFLLAAQYSNGGWPQYFPLRSDYSRHITYNDDAMIGVMMLLRDAAGGRPPFEFVDNPRRTNAMGAVTRGIQVVLQTQIKVNGALTGWCQQHDEVTLQPAMARAYEHPSIASKETVTIVRFLMLIDRPDAAVVASVDGAVAWLRAAAIQGQRLDRVPNRDAVGGLDSVIVPDPKGPDLWARFYEIGTNRPIYSGRDGVVKYQLSEIELERRSGYSWIGPYAASIEKDYAAWTARVRVGLAFLPSV